MRPARSRAGFTLLELMVALTVGGIAISSIYAVGAASTRNFHRQMQVAQTQSALRAAMAQVKRDVTRAGFLGTPGFRAPGQECAPGVALPAGLEDTNRFVAGFSTFQDDVAGAAMGGAATGNLAAVGLNTTNGFTNDVLVMQGNYETAAEYPGIVLDGASTVLVSQNWHAFQRDFTDWPNGGGLVGLFPRAFAPGRLVRLLTTKRQMHFGIISNSAEAVGAPATVTLNAAVPEACRTDLSGGSIAPISTIRYTIEDDPAVSTGTTNFGPVTQLVRTEVDPTNPTTALNGVAARRVVLDMAVAFNVSFLLNQVTALNDPDNYANVAYDDTMTWAAHVPPRVRGVSIQLAARAPEHEDLPAWITAAQEPAGLCANLRCFKVFNRTGGARVRVASAEVFVPNIAYEGY